MIECHTEILERTGCKSIEATITQHQLRWLGYVTRMPHSRLPRKVFYGQLQQGQRSAGGQKKRFKDQLKMALKRCKIKPADLENTAADHNTWRQLCLDGTNLLEEERTARRHQRRLRRNASTPMSAININTIYAPRATEPVDPGSGFSAIKEFTGKSGQSSLDSMDNCMQASVCVRACGRACVRACKANVIACIMRT